MTAPSARLAHSRTRRSWRRAGALVPEGLVVASGSVVVSGYNTNKFIVNLKITVYCNSEKFVTKIQKHCNF